MPATPAMQHGRETFLVQLPRLLETNLGEWVGYHGSNRLGVFKSPVPIYRLAEKSRIADDELFVSFIDPSSDFEEELRCRLTNDMGELHFFEDD